MRKSRVQHGVEERVLACDGERSPLSEFGGSARTSTSRQADEPAAVKARYARRRDDDRRYSLLNPAALLATQERQRAIAGLLVNEGWLDLTQVRLVEVGCG